MDKADSSASALAKTSSSSSPLSREGAEEEETEHPLRVFRTKERRGEGEEDGSRPLLRDETELSREGERPPLIREKREEERSLLLGGENS